MPEKSKRTGPVKESVKESPQPRSANDPRQQEVGPNPDRNAEQDRAAMNTIERSHTPGS